MTTKQYLEQIDRYNKLINNRLSEVWQLRQLATNIGITYKDDNIQTFGSKDSLGDTVSKIADKENETNSIIERALESKETIVRQIESLDDVMCYQVLFQKYVLFMTFDKIAELNSYSIRQIMRIYDRALKMFEAQYLNYYINL